MLPAEQMLRLTCAPAVRIQLHAAAVAGQRVVHSAHVALQHSGWALIRVGAYGRLWALLEGRCIVFLHLAGSGRGTPLLTPTAASSTKTDLQDARVVAGLGISGCSQVGSLQLVELLLNQPKPARRCS